MLVFVGQVGHAGTIGPLWVDPNNPNLTPELKAPKDWKPNSGWKPNSPPVQATEPRAVIYKEMIFSEAARVWLETRKPFLSKATLVTYQEFSDQLVKFFGAVRLESIGPDQIRAYQAARIEKAGGERINHEIGCVLKGVLKRAGLWTRISDDYERLPEPISIAGRSLESEQEDKLWKMAKSRPEWRVAYRAAQIAANTTATGRELKAVRIKHVRLSDIPPRLEIPAGKNQHRVRIVPLNDIALEAIRDVLARAKELGAVEPDHYLLPLLKRGEGNVYDPEKPMVSWRWAWRKLTRACGLRGLRFHDLRHHAVSVMGEEGVPDGTIKAVAGHVTQQMLDHYSHHRIEAKQRAVKALERRPVQNGAKPSLLLKPKKTG